MKKSLVWIIVGAAILIALIAAFAPRLLSWLIPGMGAAGLAGASAVNRKKREEEKAVAEADKAQLERLNAELAKKRAELANAKTEQQQLFVTHNESLDQLNEQYKKMVDEELEMSQATTAQAKLDYLKSRRSSDKNT